MKYLIKFLAIIGLLSMSHVAVAVDNVADGDVLTAATMNAHIDTTNANNDDIAAAKKALANDSLTTRTPIGAGTTPPAACIAKVGDTGPGGGWIFFVTADKCRGLEASKMDLNAGAKATWGCSSTDVGAYGEAFGDGYDNTSLIIGAGCSTALVDAANLTVEYTWPNAQTDGYLPATNELKEMYATIGQGAANVGNFRDDVYWGSTEDGITSPENAYSIQFSSGNALTSPKTFKRFVRAVRIFDLDP